MFSGGIDYTTCLIIAGVDTLAARCEYLTKRFYTKEKKKMGWEQHEEVKLVHQVEQEIGSRGEARFWKSDQWLSEKGLDEPAWEQNRNEYLEQFEERWDCADRLVRSDGVLFWAIWPTALRCKSWNISRNCRQYIHCEPKKNIPKCFCHIVHKTQPIVIKFSTHCAQYICDTIV